MSFLKTLVAGATTGAVLRQVMLTFGGEDPLGEAPDGERWHHEGLSRKACQAAGFSADAENAIAFHADYLDSYLYNPLWWLDPGTGGGEDRVRVVLASQAELVKLHFDDLFSTDQVVTMWRRYLSGTVAALIWLGHDPRVDPEQRVAMAHNVLGASLHAMQDFFSHSNWIDEPHRRGCTWFETAAQDRGGLVLWTGSYEIAHHLGVKPHGAYTFACTVLNNLGPAGRRAMQAICHAASPFAGSQLCTWFGDCSESVNQQPPTVEIPGFELEVNPPPGTLWVHPGINLDSRWQAPLGAHQRGLEISGDEAFDVAYELAFQNSCQWLHLLGHTMSEAGLDEFWRSVRENGVPIERYKTGTAAWEDFDTMPYRFLTAGAYPPADDDGWFLRLSIQTSDVELAGTDAEIVPVVDGRRLPALDHGVPPRSPGPGMAPSSSIPELLIGHNDFERGDRAAYILGPLPSLPDHIELLNDAPGAGQVVTAALDDLWDAVTTAFQSLAGAIRNLWGYDADFVDSDHRVLGANELSSLIDGQQRGFTLTCDGASEGAYLVEGDVRPTGVTGAFANGVPWREYRVRFTRLVCLRESAWDRFTTSDEPFVLGLVVPHGGAQSIQKWLGGPFVDVDSGETRTLDGDLVVRIPQGHGFISVACAVYESDDETPNDRATLLDVFAGQIAERTLPVDRSFFETLAASIASAWKVDWVDAVAFRRGSTVEVRIHERRQLNRWVSAGETVTIHLGEADTWAVDVLDQITCGCPPPCHHPSSEQP